MQDGVSSYHRYLQGDGNALEELVALYSDALIRFAACYVRNFADAEDIAEDSFVALILKKKHFKEDAALKAYLFKICRNKCLDFLRRNKRLTALEDWAKSEDAEALLARRDRDRILYAALGRISEQYRDILYLTYIEGFSADECTRILKKSNKQVYNLLHRAKEALRAQLEKGGFKHENL